MVDSRLVWSEHVIYSRDVYTVVLGIFTFYNRSRQNLNVFYYYAFGIHFIAEHWSTHFKKCLLDFISEKLTRTAGTPGGLCFQDNRIHSFLCLCGRKYIFILCLYDKYFLDLNEK